MCPHECAASSNCTVSIGAGADKLYLFNLDEDPREQHDLSEDKAYSKVLQMMVGRRTAAADSHFQTTDSGRVYSDCAASWEANLKAHRNKVATPKTSAPGKLGGAIG